MTVTMRERVVILVLIVIRAAMRMSLSVPCADLHDTKPKVYT